MQPRQRRFVTTAGHRNRRVGLGRRSTDRAAAPCERHVRRDVDARSRNGSRSSLSRRCDRRARPRRFVVAAGAGRISDARHSSTISVAVADALLAETGHARIAYGIGSSFGGIVTAMAEARRHGLFERIAMLDPPIHPDDALRAQLDPSGGIVDPRPPIAAQARKRNAVWPSRDSARAAWQDKPMFKAWQPRAFDLYLAEGFRDRPDGQVELKCRPDVEATIFATSGDLDIFAAAPRIARAGAAGARRTRIAAGAGIRTPATPVAPLHDARTRRRAICCRSRRRI